MINKNFFYHFVTIIQVQYNKLIFNQNKNVYLINVKLLTLQDIPRCITVLGTTNQGQLMVNSFLCQKDVIKFYILNLQQQVRRI